MYKIKKLVRKLIKVIAFIPIIWKDEDWDFSYLLQLMLTKLAFMKLYFEQSNIIADSESKKVINGIKKTLGHMEDFYNCESGVYKVKPPFEVTHKSIPSPDHEGLTQFVTLRKDTGKELTNQEEKQYTEYLRSTLKEEEDCWNAIWDTIKAEGRNWWD